MDKKILDALYAINPGNCNYQEWINIGMALKEEGYSASDWEEWSARDAGRYHRGECAKKWRTFGGSADPVAGGTIIEMAKQKAGWTYSKSLGVLGWDDEIGNDSDRDAPHHQEQSPCAQLKEYIETLFKPDEFVYYCVKSFKGDDGKWRPSGDHYCQKAKDLLALLEQHPDDLGAVIGDWEPECGAWIRFNPFDGNGYKDENITAYRFTLAESDTLPIDEQYRILKESNLPIAALVESGGKSLHAIIRIDAKDREEYRERVRETYEYLDAQGFKVDSQNKNPSRLSRMPGVTRNGKIQRLTATNIGAKDWLTWHEELTISPLPEIVSLADKLAHPDPIPEPIIEGLLRRGHKMLISGSSKVGKSFLLMELCVAFAEGLKWVGTFQCKQCRVLYVNLEIDPASAVERFRQIYNAMGLTSTHPDNIQILNLRGQAKPLDELVPQVVARIKDRSYGVVILDPIYKVITGDENNASDMGKFCNQFDKLCRETGCAAIYCHHHSKGAQGAKKAQDRASGSGVFARDPDAQVDIIEIHPSQRATDQAFDDEEAHPMRFDATLEEDNPPTAFRMEFTAREFATPRPVNMWFKWPLHVADRTGMLDDASADGEQSNNLAQSGKRQNALTATRVNAAYKGLSKATGGCQIKQLADTCGVTERTVRRFLTSNPELYEWDKKNGWISANQQNKQGGFSKRADPDFEEVE